MIRQFLIILILYLLLNQIIQYYTDITQGDNKGPDSEKKVDSEKETDSEKQPEKPVEKKNKKKSKSSE
jgi:hypothetical protein